MPNGSQVSIVALWATCFCVMLRLIGLRQKFATVYSAIYFQKPDFMSNITCDWSM